MSLTPLFPKSLSSIAVLNFKKAIALQLSRQTGQPEAQLIHLLEHPKVKQKGQFSLPVLKLLASRPDGQEERRKLTKETRENLDKEIEEVNPVEHAKGLIEKVGNRTVEHIALSLKNIGAMHSALLFQSDEFISSVTSSGTYLNFHVQRAEFIKQVLYQVVNEKEAYGTCRDIGDGKTVLIDFSSPNIAKPFHAGHLRSTILGNFVKRIHEAMGFKTISLNYLGDWGKQYGLLAIGFNKFGSREELIQNPIHHLHEVYVKISTQIKDSPEISEEANQYFKKMEDGDESLIRLWDEFRNLSINEYQKIYKRLNIEFDVYSGESQIRNDVDKVHSLLRSKGLLQEESDGSVKVNLENFNLGSPVLKRTNETSLYLIRDIAAALDRKEKYKFDQMYYVVGVSQKLHFQRLFKILELLDITNNEKKENWLQHIDFGIINGMSTRRGTAVFLQDLLDTAQQQMLDIMKENQDKYKEILEGINPQKNLAHLEGSFSNQIKKNNEAGQKEDIDILSSYGEAVAEKVADIVGISAVVVQDFQRDRIKDYDFSWERMTGSRGDTGVYLQYAHARLSGIEEKANVSLNTSADSSILQEPEAFELAFQISQYPDFVWRSFQKFQPSILANYLFNLAHSISQAVRVLRVKEMKEEIAEPRLLLFWAAKITLGNGLKLLGLTPLNKM
ncbi:hypothetical protein G9A89_005465 [Geosiphon pyriformis]|nr:hypothetical protein G9A89_005465 [Geosiphon pyriformis]